MRWTQLFERRLLLAAAVVDLELRIDATEGNDLIVVAFNSGSGRTDVLLNGVSQGTFAPTDFTSIVIDGLGGDDSVTLDTARRGRIDGGAGNDTLVGGAGDDKLAGGAGNDVLDGGGGSDVLRGDRGTNDDSAVDSGNDQLFGRSGLDALESAGGNDLLDGGSGAFDRVDFSRRTEDLTIRLDGIANDGAAGETSQVIGIETLTTGAGDDFIEGDGRGNDLAGLGGSDTIIGHGGDDTLTAGIGGGSLESDTTTNSLDGGSGDDLLTGAAGSDVVNGQAGNDTLSGAGGADQVFGGSGNDKFELFASGQGDTAFGDAGDDTFSIFGGDHTADCGSGADFMLVFDTGTTTLFGAGGNDTFAVRFSNSPFFVASGGSGIDTLSEQSGVGINVSLDNVANDGRASDPGRSANVRSDFEQISGTVGGDLIDASAAPHGMFISGASGADTLIGSAFADTLEGGDAGDSLVGNAGEDILRGGGGPDTLIGGTGSDSFNGGFGNDFIDAADGQADIVNGAQGLGDSAEINVLLDTLVRVEITT